MKQIEFANNGKSSKVNSRHITMHIIQRVVAMLVVLCGVCSVQAQEQYVFMFKSGSTYYFLPNIPDNHDKSVNDLSSTTIFNEETCVFERSGTTLFNGNYYLRYAYTSGSTNYYGLSLSENSSFTNWTSFDNGRLSYNTYYVNFYNSGKYWRNTTATTNNQVLYQYIKHEGIPTIPTISGATTLSVLNQMETYTHATSSYTPTYAEFQGYSGSSSVTYYLRGNDWLSSKPSSTTSGITYSWSLEGIDNEYAEISSDGVVTYKKLIISEHSHVATIKCTATYTATGATITATYNVTFINPSIPETPTISCNNANETNQVTVTISSIESDVDIYYTTDGSTTPSSTSGTKYTGPFNVTSGTTIKAVAVRGSANSAVASQKVEIQQGISDGVVTLDDREDHNWTYYQSQGNLPTGYPTANLSSPDPRNIKITYKGNGQLANGTAVTSVRVGIDDRNTDTFIYYKTIENNDGYRYTTIPNPFYIRPKVDDKYYGFSHWKITSISGGTITGKAVGSTINAETELVFVPSSTYTPNCISMEVVLEAVWDVAEVKTGSSKFSNNYGVERMFRVITSDATSDITAESMACTYTSIYPNGTTDGNTNATMNNRKYRYGGFTAKADSKFEYIILRDNSSVINGIGHNLTIGRGVTGYNNGLCATEINGCSNSQTNSGVDNFNFLLRIESGKYEEVCFIADHYSYNGSKAALVPKGNKNHVSVVLGNDYDRANNNNSNLDVTSGLILSNFVNYANQNKSSEILNLTCKSGTFCSEVTDGRMKISGDVGMSIYLGDNFGSYLRGTRSMLVEGGNLMCIAGGTDESNDVDKTNVNLRVKGGLIRGSIYGAAARLAANGHRRFIFTGGTVNGWVAGGCNGTDAENGKMTGDSFIYVGGNSHVEQNSFNRYIGSSRGGNIFGAGSGIEGGTTVGQVTNSNIVVSDNSVIGSNVFGGGNYGYVNEGTGHGSNIYILGGDVKGSVFGGSNQQQGQTVNIFMDNGLVETGIYGGSNEKGNINKNVTMQINGGQVGTTTASANIHGGGYGKDTEVTGNIDITLGKDTEDDTETGAVIYGNVYGGSALGKVNGSGNGTTIDSNKHTYVTMNLGSVNGNIFGGGMGELSSTGRNATPVAGEGVVNGQIKVTINGTDATKVTGTTKDYAVDGVFGGCDMVGYAGTPVVIVDNCKSSIEYVYGGGNASSVTGTNVTINGGDIDYAFGGGNGADATKPGANVNGNAVLNIFGGTINNIFGGSNTLGDVTGKATVTLEDKNDDCPITAEEVYGGANEAPMTGTPELKIVCLNNKLGSVYGGARAVDVNSDVTLTITGGQYGKVFGGNNESGEVKGSITVNIDETGCHPIIIDELYAGGNMAAYTTPTGKSEPTVNVISCTHIGQVFGGGYGKTAVITGNPIVNINQIPGKYDPEDDDSTDGYSDNTDGKLGTIGTVFGGGNAANVVGDTHVNIGTQANNKHLTTGSTDTPCGANISGNVYGGGNAADVTGKTNVTIGRSPTTTP